MYHPFNLFHSQPPSRCELLWFFNLQVSLSFNSDSIFITRSMGHLSWLCKAFLSRAFFLLSLLWYCFESGEQSLSESSSPHNHSGYSESSFIGGSSPVLKILAPTHTSMFRPLDGDGVSSFFLLAATRRDIKTTILNTYNLNMYQAIFLGFVASAWLLRPQTLPKTGIFSHVSDVQGRKDLIVCRQSTVAVLRLRKERINSSCSYSLGPVSATD